MVNCLLSDFLVRWRNGSLAGLKKIKVLNSSFIRNVLIKLQICGYIDSYMPTVDEKYLEVVLKYYGHNKPVLRSLRRISKPGCRIYAKMCNLQVLHYKKSAFEELFLSTSKGVLTLTEARKIGVGGEVLFGVI